LPKGFPSYRRKIVTAEALAAAVAARQSAGETVVFTNGVFDLVHAGHLRYLYDARCLGDALAVAVNADSSVRMFKGDLRPIVGEDDRAELLASLEFVDYVILFDTRTPEPLLAAVKPLIYVKGGDYTVDQLPETAVVRTYGGDVRILPFVPGRSTTGMIEKIVAAYGPGRAKPV
jgi:D-beta-D-heptose 7-phosphate kinase/D-beta-D-heptose 1-phosphate adenosyltransferase